MLDWVLDNVVKHVKAHVAFGQTTGELQIIENPAVAEAGVDSAPDLVRLPNAEGICRPRPQGIRLLSRHLRDPQACAPLLAPCQGRRRLEFADLLKMISGKIPGRGSGCRRLTSQAEGPATPRRSVFVS